MHRGRARLIQSVGSGGHCMTSTALHYRPSVDADRLLQSRAGSESG